MQPNIITQTEIMSITQYRDNTFPLRHVMRCHFLQYVMHRTAKIPHGNLRCERLVRDSPAA